MKINWDIMNPAKPPPITRFRKWLYRMVFNTNSTTACQQPLQAGVVSRRWATQALLNNGVQGDK